MENQKVENAEDEGTPRVLVKYLGVTASLPAHYTELEMKVKMEDYIRNNPPAPREFSDRSIPQIAGEFSSNLDSNFAEGLSGASKIAKEVFAGEGGNPFSATGPDGNLRQVSLVNPKGNDLMTAPVMMASEAIVKPIGDSIVDFFKAAGETISVVAPDEVQNMALDGLEGIGKILKEPAETVLGAGGTMIKATGVLEPVTDFVDWLGTQDPSLTKKIAATAELALVKNINKDPTSSLTGRALAKSAAKSERGRRESQAFDALEPDVIPANAMDTTGSTTKWVPNEFNTKLIELVKGTSAWDTNASLPRNYNNLKAIVDGQRTKLDYQLGKLDYKLDTAVIFRELDAAVFEAAETMSAEAQARLPAFIKEAKRLITNTDASPAQLTQARRDLDAYFKSIQPDAFESSFVNAKAGASEAVRNVLNRNIIDRVGDDVPMAGMLKRQSDFLTFMGRIEEKVEKTAKTAIGRTLKETQELTGMSPFGATMLASTAALTSIGSILYDQAWIAAALASGASVYTLAKTAAHPQVRSLLGRLLKANSKLINKADKASKKVYMADRAVLLSLIDDYDKAAEEKEPKEK